MNRDSQLLYLRDVRDLELAKAEIRRQTEQEHTRSLRLQKRLADPDIDNPNPTAGKSLRSKANLIIITAFVFFLVVEAALFLRDIFQGRPPRYSLIFFLVIGLFLFFIWNAVSYMEEDTLPSTVQRRRQEDLQSFVLEPLNGETTRSDIELQLERCRSRLRTLARDEKSLRSVLAGYYGMGILPQEYQNLAAVYYLYEYMNLLVQPLAEVLADPMLDERIIKTQMKLEAVIRTQEHLWKERRRKELSNPGSVEQTEAMLMHISRTAPDPAEAAVYAQLSVYYSATFAFFTKAAYLLEER